MRTTKSLLLALICALLVCGCQYLSPLVRVLRPDPIKIPPLAPEIAVRQEPNLCPRLLQIFSLSQQMAIARCGGQMPVSTLTTPSATR